MAPDRPMRIVAGDIGGTNARFAIAELVPGQRPRLSDVKLYPTADHDGLPSAWEAFDADFDEPMPRAAAIGVATGLGEDVLRFANNDWVIDQRTLAGELGLDRLLLLNDFGAMAHGVSVLGPDELGHIKDPQGALPEQGVTTVIGPGTGLGVAMILRRGAHVHIIETEGAHMGFAPLDEEEERIEHELRIRYGRCSVERVVSGPGLLDLYRALGGRTYDDDIALWTAALKGNDPAATEALERLVKAFGSAAGDLALAHGSNAVVISSGLSKRMAVQLRTRLFTGRFVAKGRYRRRMEAMPVRLVLHDQPGLLGAAVAFQREVLGR
ncbi:glucokinase [Sphingosinicella sp. CPCC 101087]|uniref:glucokinase n=1 Tax=Sphingosinicella sp. CPCC 101087 TaxID=2497754 RepID=UPI001FB0E393|nr:ROK family protein [Sphingosinicella sp. CPCC 101087]